MLHLPTRALSAACLIAAAILGLAACSSAGAGGTPSSGTGSNSAAASGSTGLVPPVIVDLSSIDGMTVNVPVGRVIDLVTAPGDDVTAWSGTVSDTSIAKFVPGRNDGSAQFNPGIDALAVGMTGVVLTNSATKARVSFTVDVTSAAN